MARKTRWVQNVKSVSTFPPKGLFTKSAEAIARSLASPRVSPKGPASGLRMLQYFINRAGKGMSTTRRRELEKAKHLMQEKAARGRAKPKQPRRKRAATRDHRARSR